MIGGAREALQPPPGSPVETERERNAAVRSELGRWQRLIPSRRQALIAFALAGALLLINDLFIFESVYVPSSSMRPTILPNERVFLQKIHSHDYKRFEVVVANSHALHKRIVKRIIGVPGDRVKIESAWKVSINGQPLAYEPAGGDDTWLEGHHHLLHVVKSDGSGPEPRFGSAELLVGANEYYVLGDNRLASDDSRWIGPVSGNEIEGTVTRIWYSYNLQNNRLRTNRILARVH